MTVHPFPEPEPSPFENFCGNLFSIVPVGSIVGGFTNVFGDLTLEGLWDEVKDMPVQDVLKALFGISGDGDESASAS